MSQIMKNTNTNRVGSENLVNYEQGMLNDDFRRIVAGKFCESDERVEPMARIELATPSLPRKCSTPELHRQVCGESRIRTYEGIRQQIYSLPQLAALVSPQLYLILLSRWRDSNPRPADYKSAALAN